MMRRPGSWVPGFIKEHGIDFAVWVGANADDLYKRGMGEAVPATPFIVLRRSTCNRNKVEGRLTVCLSPSMPRDVV
jgi:hypothetical protein